MGTCGTWSRSDAPASCSRCGERAIVGVAQLKQSILRGVNISGAGNVFNQLTLTFDQALLYCIGAVTPERAKTSLNMNVETVFTNAFEHYLRDGGDAGLKGVIVEFRQDNMFQHFSQFQTACELIANKGGSVAIDNVQTETLGVVNLHRLKVKMAKIGMRHMTYRSHAPSATYIYSSRSPVV